MTEKDKAVLPAFPGGGIKWQTPLRLPEVGKIKIGKKGEARQKQSGAGSYRLPTFDDKFTVTTLARDRNGDYVPDKAVMDAVGPNCRELDVMMLFDDVDLNLVEYLGYYRGSTLWCRGNGVVAQRLKEEKGRDRNEIACPCPFLEPDGDGKSRCGPHGVLSVLLPTLSKTIGGVYTFRSGSANSLKNLRASLTFIKSLTGGVLARIPLKLRVTMETKQTQGGAKTVPIVSIVFEPKQGGNAFQELYDRALEISRYRSQYQVQLAEIENERRKALAYDIPDGDDEPARSVLAEFQPNNQDGLPEDAAKAKAVEDGIAAGFAQLDLPDSVRKVVEESVKDRTALLARVNELIAEKVKKAQAAAATPQKPTVAKGHAETSKPELAGAGAGKPEVKKSATPEGSKEPLL